MKNKKTIASQLILIVVVLVLVNLLSTRFFIRLDFTGDKIYTLSKATKDILHSLNEPVTVTAYFTKGSQPEIEKARKDFQDLLIEYSTVSKGMVNYEFVNPNDDQQIEQEAMQAGIQPLVLNVREKDQVKQQRVYLGAKLAMGDRTDIIPVIQPGAAMEFTLSSAIKKLSVVDKPRIGFLQGNGQPAVSSMMQAMEQLQVLYEVVPVDLNDESVNLSEYLTLVMIAPSDSFSDFALQRLDDYLSGGGRMFIAHNHVSGDFQTMQGNLSNCNLSSWLINKGLTIEDHFVVDKSAGNIGVRQQTGFMTFTRQIPFHYWPAIRKFPNMPITKGLNEVILQFASGINFTGDTTLKFTPILQSSDKSGTLTVPLYFNIEKQWSDRDFPLSGITLGAVLQGPIVGTAQSKIVLITDGDFAVNGEGQNAQPRPADNISLMVNAIDWLSDDTGLIDLRTKEVTSRPLDELEEGSRTWYKWINFLLPIGIVLMVAIIRMQMTRRKRIKRMEEGYV
ncbi:MAG TPA: GldG family protein [Bacteroidales bacterium]|nr:GldG family protein [Bacteroidales bacterium]HPR59071.1 GldG family protein [Bacteroidales bacterium]HRW96435.1 GldG family protein [Bacteroidales bacterium]